MVPNTILFIGGGCRAVVFGGFAFFCPMSLLSRGTIV